MTDGGTNTLALRGLEEPAHALRGLEEPAHASRGLEEPYFPVVLLCCVSFWFWQEMRELALHYFLADWFGIKREIVFGVTYVLSVQYSCADVSVFCCGGKVNFVRIPYSHDRLKLKLIHIRYRTDLHIEVQIRILLKDK
jgi:hypothetical protein